MADALGMVEVGGLATAVVAANIAVNTADVRIQGFGYLHGGTVMLSVRRSVAAVQVAVAAVKERSGPGSVRTSSVLARLDDAVEPILVERTVRVGSRVGAPRVRGRGRAYNQPDRPTQDGSQAVPSAQDASPAMGPAKSGAPGKARAPEPVPQEPAAATPETFPTPAPADGDGTTT